jgi:hypothetical protein
VFYFSPARLLLFLNFNGVVNIDQAEIYSPKPTISLSLSFRAARMQQQQHCWSQTSERAASRLFFCFPDQR